LKAAANKVAEALATEGVITSEQTEAMSSKLVAAAKATEGEVTTEVIAQDVAEVASKGAVTGAKASATAGTWAHVVALIAEKLAMAPLLVIVILLTAALGALALITWGIVAAVKAFIANSPEGKLKSAKEESEHLANALEDAKQASEELKASFDKYNNIIDTLESCKKGT
jgi:polyhydroxyalkanoate synthesis regulator phasin